MRNRSALATVLFSLTIGVLPAAWAVDAASVAQDKRTTLGLYLTAAEAYALKQRLGAKAFFVDIRTKGETAFVGVPTLIDAVVPYVDFPDIGLQWDDRRGAYRLEPNSDFLPELKRRLAEQQLTPADPVIVMCRSGDRSARAINQLLAQAGFTQVYSVVDGFEGDLSEQGRRDVNGWKNSQLPWTYKLDKNKAYLPR